MFLMCNGTCLRLLVEKINSLSIRRYYLYYALDGSVLKTMCNTMRVVYKSIVHIGV